MSTTTPQPAATAAANEVVQKTVFSILVAISFSHMLNDTMQSLIPSTYPLLKKSLHLDFSQLGLITFCFQLTASLLQPFVGMYTDKKPQPFSLAAGMCFTLCGLVLLSRASTFPLVLVAVGLVGVGSSIFHPEASRLAYLASGGKRGMAQSIFQLGGNAGASLGPLLAAQIVAPYGQSNIIWFGLFALLAIGVLLRTGAWYSRNLGQRKKRTATPAEPLPFSRVRVATALLILLVLIFSKYFYMASMSSYYTFFLLDKFHVSVQTSQMMLFVFLFAVAAGTMIGGPLGDRIGRKYVIWFSILGVAPFTLALPYANLFWTGILSVCIGLILASAFSSILVYAQELVPGKVGLIAGLFFGLAFGMGGIGAAVLGRLADQTSIRHVFHLCSFLPLLGLLTMFIPNTHRTSR
ncbi:MAG TPA: MFS transporter [Puia sp.]|jgi:FSR family fosmidomycin resistance protein-like MFS transporter|nr:MFS transporter [Puia sp.]